MGPHMFDDAILGCKAVFIGAIILALLAGNPKPMTHSEAINIYRAITGACREGIRQWMNGKDLPDPITIRQVIDMTSEDYGGREFAKFFEVGR